MEEWNDIHDQFKVLAQDLKLQAKESSTKKVVDEVDLNFNILKSDGGLSQTQHTHTNELPVFSLGSNTKYLHLVTITDIENKSLF